MNNRVVVIDSQIANIGSVMNMCRKIGFKDVVVTNKPTEILEADRIILPGVGHYSSAAKLLDELELRDPLNEAVLVNKTPILGICLGMQLLCNGSDEGEGAGLGWIPGRCVRFQESADLKVPHMGWNHVEGVAEDCPLTQLTEPHPRFYHVHSYHIVTEPEYVMFTTTYGTPFISGVYMGNIFGVQFHPEKSHIYGMELLKIFCNL